MGLFLDQQYTKQSTSSSGTCYVNGNYGNYGCGNVKFGDMLLLSIPSLFMFGLQQFGDDESVDDGKDKDNEPKISKKTQAKIDEKNKELEAVYSKASEGRKTKITKISDFNTAIQNVDTKIDAKNIEIANLKPKVAGDKSSASIGAKLEPYYDLNTGRIKSDVPIDKETEAHIIPDNIPSYQEYKDALAIEQQIKDKEDEVKTLQAEKISLTASKGEAENILNEINKLKNEDTGVDYDVDKEANDIKAFMTALNNFQTNPSQETASALKKAKDNGDEKNGKDGVQQASVVKAYEMVTKQYPAFF